MIRLHKISKAPKTKDVEKVSLNKKRDNNPVKTTSDIRMVEPEGAEQNFKP